MTGVRSPLQLVQIRVAYGLEDYEANAHLATATADLKAEAVAIAARLSGRTVWQVSSTATGGGVAEMLPPTVKLLRDLGINAQWIVIGSRDPGFFELTKHIHNLIHGTGDSRLGTAARELFERVNRENAIALRELVSPGDIVVVHDPQSLPLAGLLQEAVPLRTIWRCHIGLDVENTATRSAWNFLGP